MEWERERSWRDESSAEPAGAAAKGEEGEAEVPG